MKKFLALLLASVMLIGCFGTVALADEKPKLSIMYAVDKVAYTSEDWILHAYEHWDKKNLRLNFAKR